MASTVIIGESSPNSSMFDVPPFEAEPIPISPLIPAVIPSLEIFSEVERIDGTAYVGGDEIDYTIHNPAGLEVGTIMTRLINGGFYGSHPFYKLFGDALARRGETAITYAPHRHPGVGNFKVWRTIRHPEHVQTRAALAVASDVHRNFRHVTEYDASGHSKGDETALELCQITHDDPRHIRAVSATIIQGAGANRHNTATLLARTPKLKPEVDQVRQKSRELGDHLGREAMFYGAENLPLTIAEGIQVSNCNVVNKIRLLRRLGIPVVALYHDKDPYFPAREAHRNIGRIVNKFIFGSPAHAGHMAPYLYPDEMANDISLAFQETGLYERRRPVLVNPTS